MGGQSGRRVALPERFLSFPARIKSPRQSTGLPTAGYPRLLADRKKFFLEELGLVLTLVAAGLFLTQTFLPALSHQTHGFAAYYTGAWLFQHGRILEVYDSVSFNAAMQQTGIQGIYDIYDANAPLLAVLTAPLALWPPMIARAVWLWFNLGLLIIILIFAIKLLGINNLFPGGLVSAGLLLYAPLNENFRLGQMYLPFLLASLLSLFLTNTVGGALNLMLETVLKLYYGVFGLVAGLARLKMLALSLALLAAITLALLPWLTLKLWLDYFSLAFSFANRPYIGITAYQTLNGFFSHLLRYDATWNPVPIVNLPTLAQWLALGISSLLGLITLWAIWRLGRKKGVGWLLNSDGLQLSLALSLSLALLLSPAAEEYHFTILILPLLVSLKFLFNENLCKVSWIVWLIAVILLAIPWPYKTWAATGWLALTAYPRLYGTLLLWGLLLRLSHFHYQIQRN
jgi:hypothetical protein